VPLAPKRHNEKPKSSKKGIRTNSFTYSSGNLASQTNELGLVTTRNYDPLNRLTQINFPDGNLTAFRWSSLNEYLKPPRQRPSWLRVERLLGESLLSKLAGFETGHSSFSGRF